MEYSYMELLNMLKSSLDTDEMMPKDDNEQAVKKVAELFDILWNYSY